MLSWMLGCGWLTPVDEPRLVRLQGIDVPDVEHAGEVELESFRLAEWDVERTSCEEMVDGRFAIVEVDGSSLTFAGKPLDVPVHDGLIGAADRRDRLIAELYGEMLAAVEMSKDIGAMGCVEDYVFRGRVLLSIDRGVPMATVEQVVFTAKQAQLAWVYLLVDDPSPVATLPEPATVDGKDTVRVELDPSGAALWSKDHKPDALAYEEIACALAKERAKVVVWAARPEMSFGSVLTIIDGAIDDTPPSMGIVGHDGEGTAGTPGTRGTPRTLDPASKVPVLSWATEVKPTPRPVPAVPKDTHPPLRPSPKTSGEVDRQIRILESQIRYCHTTEQMPERTGAMDVSFEVLPNGTVGSATASTDLPETLARCVEGRLLRMQLPPGHAGSYEERFVFGG